MSGNVWEWVEDCWHENYERCAHGRIGMVSKRAEVIAASVWSAAVPGTTYRRTCVIVPVQDQRRHRNNDIGFRLAQDLP